jgi:hypothetical protein
MQADRARDRRCPRLALSLIRMQVEPRDLLRRTGAGLLLRL